MRKLRAYKYALMIGACVFFTLNCERTILPVDSSKKIDYEQGNTKASVTIKLFDSYSMAPISGAKVSINDADSSLTDSNGSVVFDSLKVGTYLVSCSKIGFESIYDELSLTIDSNSNTVPIVNQSTDFYLMAKKGAVVKGNVYYENDNKNIPANGAIVECRLNDLSFQNPLRVTTSVNGTYTFTDLPEHTKYTISVRPFSDGLFTYKKEEGITCDGKSTGDTIFANNIILPKKTTGDLIILGHNLDKFTKSDSLIFEFSEAVDTSKIGPDSIYVLLQPELSEIQSGIRILVRLKWLNNNKILTIKPFDGVWRINESYKLRIGKLFSVTGKTSDKFEQNISPITSGILNNVMNLSYSNILFKPNYNTTSINLKWSKLPNAAYYQIYQKAPSDSVWTIATSEEDTTVTLSLIDGLGLGKQYKFIVLGKNSTNVSSFESATVFAVKDETGPRILAQTLQRYDFDNSSYSLPQLLTVFSATLPEPMDTTKKPVLKVVEGSYYDEDLSEMFGDSSYRVSDKSAVWTWTSLTTGNMSVIVDSNKNGAYDTLKIDFTSVPDYAGNKPDTTFGAGVITLLTTD